METPWADSERLGFYKVKAGLQADRVGSDSIVVGRDLRPVTECTASVILLLRQFRASLGSSRAGAG